jgi:hypothetical protein
MIKLTEAQPVCIAIQVNVQIHVWMNAEGHDIPHDVKPDIKDMIGLGRTIQQHSELDKPLAIVVNVEDMTERCVDAIGARLMNRLSPNGN